MRRVRSEGCGIFPFGGMYETKAALKRRTNAARARADQAPPPGAQSRTEEELRFFNGSSPRHIEPPTARFSLAYRGHDPDCSATETYCSVAAAPSEQIGRGGNAPRAREGDGWRRIEPR